MVWWGKTKRTNRGGKIFSRSRDEAEEKTTFADTRIADQQNLKRQIVAAATLARRRSHSDDLLEKKLEKWDNRKKVMDNNLYTHFNRWQEKRRITSKKTAKWELHQLRQQRICSLPFLLFFFSFLGCYGMLWYTLFCGILCFCPNFSSPNWWDFAVRAKWFLVIQDFCWNKAWNLPSVFVKQKWGVFIYLFLIRYSLQKVFKFWNKANIFLFLENCSCAIIVDISFLFKLVFQNKSWGNYFSKTGFFFFFYLIIVTTSINLSTNFKNFQ